MIPQLRTQLSDWGVMCLLYVSTLIVLFLLAMSSFKFVWEAGWWLLLRADKRQRLWSIIALSVVWIAITVTHYLLWVKASVEADDVRNFI